MQTIEINIYGGRASIGFADRMRPCDWPRRDHVAASKVKVANAPAASSNRSDVLEVSDMIASLPPQRIVSHKEVCGGVPCVRGTRISVWLLEHRRLMHRTVDEIIASFPFLSKDDVEAAFEYARTHQAEIEQQIRENTED